MPPTCKSFPRCLSLSPASLSHFVLTLNTVTSEYTLCLSTLLLNIGILFFFFFAAFLVSKHVVSNLKLWRGRFKKKKKMKNWWAPKNIGGKDRLQDRLSSSKINSQTQMKLLCHLLCFLSGTETGFIIIYLPNVIRNFRVTPPILNSNWGGVKWWDIELNRTNARCVGFTTVGNICDGNVGVPI